MSDALANVKVVEFGGYAAGPCIGKYLANFGARVVHVESQQQPDGFRLQYPPFKDDKKGINRSACFALFNDSKGGVTLNLKNPGGLEVAYRLVEWCDVVIENMRPGVMARLGLDFEALRRRNPTLVMLSSSNMGQTGPYARQPGFGSQLSSLSGFTNFIGEADGPPNFVYGPYVDFVAVAFGGVAILAALDYSRRMKEPHYLDAQSIMETLQGAGVHAAAVSTMQDLFSDPQIASRRVWQELEHPEIGLHHYRMSSYQLCDTPGRVHGPAPCLGEHNEQVFLSWLGMSRGEYQGLLDQGAFS